MAIEIREITIRTEVRTQQHEAEESLNNRDLHQFREQLLDECKRLITQKTARKKYKR